MAGEGSIQGMITILRNNEKLLRKRNPFRPGVGFERLRQAYRTYAQGEVEITPISKSRLQAIGREAKRADHKDDMRNVVVIVSAVIVAVVLTLLIWNRLDDYEAAVDAKAIAKTTKKYLFYINDGDAWLAQRKLHNAVYQYRLARELYPSEFAANHRLAMALAYQCEYERKGCYEGRALFASLQERFPKKAELEQLQILLED